MTIAHWLKTATEQLQQYNRTDAAIDARWLLEDTLNLNSTQLRFQRETQLSADVETTLNTLLARRCAGEPVQYLLHRADFMGLCFYVDENVLIPRQDTETLAEAAIMHIRKTPAPVVLDLCAGSGAIGLSVKAFCPHAEVILTDISNGAIGVIHKNMQKLDVHAEVLQGDLFAPVGQRRFDVILSNPPYIPAEDIRSLQAEVQKEPRLALDGGPDGLDIYRRITNECRNHLNPGGIIMLEVGIGQAEDVLKLLTKHGNAAASGIIKDLCGVDRVVWMEIEHAI